MRHRSDHADSAPELPPTDPSGADSEAPEGTGRARLRIGVGAAVVLLLAAAVVAVLVSASAQRGSTVAVAATSSGLGSAPPSDTVAPSATPAAVLVHVTGAVRTPGLVSLSPGARVVDAVSAAGGLTDDADPARINLARPVSDGEQLAVPHVGEAAPPAAPAASGATSEGAAAGSVVNLNTATQAELESLPRIGPALAQRILDYRQSNGHFAQTTDLLKVSGIGQKLFDGLKDRVTV